MENKYFRELAKIFGVDLCEPFKMNWQNARFRKNLYKFTDLGLMVSYDQNSWQLVNSSFNDITPDKVINLPKKPKINDKYYYPCPYKGWEENIWLDTDFDNRALEKVGVFENQQKAVVKARELGWF